MSDPGRQLRDEIEHFGEMAGNEIEALGRSFQAEVHSLIDRFHDRPEQLARMISEAGAEFQAKIAANFSGLHAYLDALAITPPVRLPYVEKTRPRPRKPFGGKRPSAGGVLVKPDFPKGLSGGAAAALEFDRD